MWIGKLKADLDAAGPVLSSTLLSQTEEESEQFSRLSLAGEEAREVATATMDTSNSADDDKHSIKATMKMFKAEFVASGSLNLLVEESITCGMTLCSLDEHYPLAEKDS